MNKLAAGERLGRILTHLLFIPHGRGLLNLNFGSSWIEETHLDVTRFYHLLITDIQKKASISTEISKIKCILEIKCILVSCGFLKIEQKVHVYIYEIH